MQLARSVSYRFFFRSCAFSQFSSQGTVNLAMLPCLATYVWIMWTGNCRVVLRFTEAFQSRAPFSSFILEFFCFLTGHSPSLCIWIMGSLAVTGCWFSVSYCALNNSITSYNTLLCLHVYIWNNCEHVDSTWRKVPRSLLHEKHRSESVYPHNFRLSNLVWDHTWSEEGMISPVVSLQLRISTTI